MKNNRKDEHLHLAEKFYQKKTNDFDGLYLMPSNLPQLDVDQTSLAVSLLNHHFTSPFFINAMTGGSRQTGQINQKLALIARETGLAMASGSQSAALKDPALRPTFEIIRETNPDGFILANLGAGQTFEQACLAIDMLEANALQIHLNAAQELVMPEGDRHFRHWLDELATIVQKSPVPVIVKEVGFGMTPKTFKQLQDIGVHYIDVAGRGGTSFSQIENARREHQEYDYLENFGLSTVQSLLVAEKSATPLAIIASGGIRQPFDVLKSLILGAKLVGVSGTFLHFMLHHSVEESISYIQEWQEQLHHLMTLCSTKNVTGLVDVPYYLDEKLLNFSKQIE